MRRYIGGGKGGHALVILVMESLASLQLVIRQALAREHEFPGRTGGLVDDVIVRCRHAAYVARLIPQTRLAQCFCSVT